MRAGRTGRTVAWVFGVASLALVSSGGAQTTTGKDTGQTGSAPAKRRAERPAATAPATPSTPTTSDTATTTPPGTQGADMRKRLDQIRNEESDQVKRVPVEMPGARIPPPTDIAGAQGERRLPPPEPREDRPATLPVMTTAQRQALFATAPYKQRFEELGQCREELSVIRKVKPAEIKAGRVQLDWTVGEDGDVQGVKVVALSPTDPDLMTCVHRKVSAWRVTPAPADPYRVSHTMKL